MEIWIPLMLFVIGFAALFLELFVPAAGVVGALGIICMITGTVLAYNSSGRLVGSIFLAGILIGTPVMIMLGLKAFPKSFVGKKLILSKSFEQKEGFTSAENEKYQILKGKEGLAVTNLRPSGMIVVDGKKYSVVTAGEMIERLSHVRVVKVEGNRIVVRKKAGKNV